MQRQEFARLIRVSRVLWLSLLVVNLGGLLKSEAAAQTVSFGPKTDFGTGNKPVSVAEGDFNGDGKLDLAVANTGGATVSILLGTGTGSFGAKTDFSTGFGPRSVAVGDFNRDGKLDLAVAVSGGNVVSILLGTGTGSFGAKTDFGTGSGPESVAVGDFNGDGNLDLAVANVNGDNGDTVSILLGTGTGSFGAKTDFSTGFGPRSVAVGDFNRDGKLDLAVANEISFTVSILLGTGTGSFGAKTDFGTGITPISVAVRDFNGDNKLDLAVANLNGDTVSILLGTGTGSFGAKTDFGTESDPVSVAVGDFNGDGKLDLAVANFSSTVSILLGTGTGSFNAKTDFGTGISPDSVAVADFSGDGKLDLAVANFNSDTVSILLNTTPTVSSGVFCPKTDFGTGLFPDSVAVGDFNGDGKLDLAVANGSNTVSILLGTGTGSFAAKTDFGTGSLPLSVAMGEFNGDGKLDLAVANDGSNTVSILLGTGTGGFGAKTDFGTGSGPASVAVGDFNGDGKLDLAVANLDSNTVSILLGTGTGSLGAKTDFGTGTFPFSVAVGDFNGDGKLDLTVANESSNTVSILLGTGTGSFGAKTDFSTGNSPRTVAVGDFNGDGRLDLAVANLGGDTVSILLGTGTGSFGAKTDFAAGIGPLSVAVGDFNGDGNLDLAVANLGSDTVSILLGTGTGSVGAKTDFVTGSLPRSVAVGDFNGDGNLDLAVANQNRATVSILLNTCSSNTSPSITANPITRTAGDPSANSQIATVNDAEDARNTLTVTVNGGTNATVNGVTVSGISVNAAGVVTANVIAACSATTANFTLRVTDRGGLFNEATLTVTVNPDNQPPTINCPANITIPTDMNNDTCRVATYAVSASDNCPNVTVVCAPSSGSCFPVGATTVNCTATDASSNTATCSFTVTVGAAPPATCAVSLRPSINTNTTTSPSMFTLGVGVCCGPNGEFLPNYTVSVSHDSTPFSSGHNHNGMPAPKGSFDRQSGVTTPAQLLVPFRYTAPDNSGPVTVTYSCNPQPCSVRSDLSSTAIGTPLPGTNLVLRYCVGVQGLQAMPAPGGPALPYLLVGETGVHPLNHFGTQRLNDSLVTLARIYTAKYPDSRLAFNDMSLVSGGVFDLDQDWMPRHKAHRLGQHIDLRIMGGAVVAQGFVPLGRRPVLREMIESLGMSIFLEDDHWHLTR